MKIESETGPLLKLKLVFHFDNVLLCCDTFYCDENHSQAQDHVRNFKHTPLNQVPHEVV